MFEGDGEARCGQAAGGVEDVRGDVGAGGFRLAFCGQQGFEAEQGDLAQFACHDPQVARVVEGEAALLFGVDFGSGAAGGADEEDAAEALLVGGVRLGDPCGQVLVPGVRGPLFGAGERGRAGLAPGLLADAGVFGQRLLDLVGPQRVGGGAGAFHQVGGGGVRGGLGHLVDPTRHGEAGTHEFPELGFGGVEDHQGSSNSSRSS